MVRPSRRGRMRALLTSEESTAVVDGDNRDWDEGGIFDPATGSQDQWKQPVRVASTASVTISTALNAGDTIDGVTLVAGDRVLLKDQSTGSQNGIYVAGTTPARAADMDDDVEVMGALVYVIAGTANGGKAYKNTNTSVPTVGSTTLTFTEFGAGGSSSFATPAIVLGSSAAAGAASTVIRSDSTIAAFDATSPTTQALGDSAVVGTAAFAARRDHKHAMPAAAITTSGHTQATARILGRTTASTGAIEEITVGSGLSLSAGSLTATGGSSALTLIGSTVLGAAASTIDVSGISGSYKDLVIVMRARGTSVGPGLGVNLRVGNGTVDSGNNYSYYEAYVGFTSGNNNSTIGTSSMPIFAMADSTATAGSFANCRIEIHNYADAAKYRGVIGQGFSYDSGGILYTDVGGVWRNTASAIDIVRILASSGNFDVGSAMTVYGRG